MAEDPRNPTDCEQLVTALVTDITDKAKALRNLVTFAAAPYSTWSPALKRQIEKLSDDGNLMYFMTLPNEWDQR